MNERTDKENLYDFPLFRVWLCGAFRLERRVGNNYSGVRTAEWGGSNYPRLLLKALLRCSGRQARREALLELLWPESDPEQAVQYFNTATTKLRKVLTPIKGQASLLMTEDDSQLYRLAEQDRLWVDVDAALTLLQEVERLGRTSWEALALLEEADSYLSQGPLLQDEEGLWATGRRATVEQARFRCRLWLAEAYEHHQMPGQAATALSQLLEEDPTDEDVLARVMRLLHRQGMTHQALRSYHAFLEAADREGLEPTETIKTLATQLATSQNSAPLDAFPTSFLPMEGQNRAISPQGRQAETRVVEVSSSPLSDEQEFLPLMDEPLEHAGPLLAETRHLLGRQEWLASVIAQMQAEIPKKLLVLHGPIGVGKSSELNRLAHSFVQQNASQVMVLSLLAREPRDPEASLDLFLGMLLSASRAAPFPADASRQTRIKLALTALAERPRPTIILLDNAEGTLTEEGTLAPCWEAFLTNVVRGQHQATLILATKEWPGWPGRDPQLVAEIAVPPLTLQDSVLLLQRLGLESVPLAALEMISQRVACIPLCLEWIATIAHDPLVHDAWEAFEVQEESSTESQLDAAQRLTRLLEHPTLLGEHLASRLTPLLEHILDRHLSADARRVLEHLAVVSIPLGKPALHVFCSRPAWLKQLRSASLLAAYTNRIQLLPTVASTVRARLSPEQLYELEERMIEALMRWVEDGNVRNDEAGNMVAELVVLLLTHHRLLDAAQLLVRFGWRSFHLGYGPRLAHLAQTVLHKVDWHQTVEQECAGLVLVQILFQFLGQPLDPKQYADYQHIQSAILDKKVALPVATGIYVTHLLMLDAANHARFEEAQALLNAYRTSLQPGISLLEEQAFLFKAWSDYSEEQGTKQEARHLRKQAINFYRALARQLSAHKEISPLEEELRKKRLASCLNNLAHHLNILGLHEEALQMVEQSIALREQGYVYFGALAASYGEKAEILMELGCFQEASVFEKKAMGEVQRCVKAGDGLSMREIAIYQVIRGRLSLHLGNVEEAERLFRDALPRIHPKRRIYRMFAQDGLNEIEQWKQQSASPQYQLDWRWIERYRQLCTYDSRWWLTWTGPFTEEEQTRWDQLITSPLDEGTKMQLGTLMKVSRERELNAAIAEQREPRLHYPAIDIQDIRSRIAAQLALQEEITKQEPNAIVRRLYQDAIEEELGYLQLIEATYEGKSERFWECNRRILPLPTRENMEYAFALVKHVVRQGREHPQTVELSQELQEFIQIRLHLSLDLTPEEKAHPESIQPRSNTTTPHHTVSAQTAQRFFATVLREGGYEDWQVTIDQNATNAHVEQGARQIYLPEKRFSLAQIKHLFIHELAGHVARLIAGSHSPLGLLGIHTKNCLPTDEGLALYYEHLAARRRGESIDDSGTRLGTLAVGLACGVMTPPQTFLSLFTFFERYDLLVRLLMRPEANREELQRQAQQYALIMCLRKYRGVPHLELPGICYLQDVVYLHGLRLIETAVAQDETVLDRLAVGNVALEYLPDLQELGITSAPQPFKQRIFDPELDAYIFSFTQSEEGTEKE